MDYCCLRAQRRMPDFDLDFSRTVWLRLDPNSSNATAVVQHEGIIAHKHARPGYFERDRSIPKCPIRSELINDFQSQARRIRAVPKQFAITHSEKKLILSSVGRER